MHRLLFEGVHFIFLQRRHEIIFHTPASFFEAFSPFLARLASSEFHQVRQRRQHFILSFGAIHLALIPATSAHENLISSSLDALVYSTGTHKDDSIDCHGTWQPAATHTVLPVPSPSLMIFLFQTSL